jgi:hypothetical protein
MLTRAEDHATLENRKSPKVPPKMVYAKILVACHAMMALLPLNKACLGGNISGVNVSRFGCQKGYLNV